MTALMSWFALPPDKKTKLDRARRVEWASIFSKFTIIAAVGTTMGTSQAMKAMWFEDALSLIPSAAFLIGARFRNKVPDKMFPYGYRRAVLVGFMTGALALFGFGVYMLLDSVLKLLEREHPSIQSVQIFGHTVWLGWIMIAVLIYSVIPPFVLGRMKLPLARELHDKTLQTSAALDKGDWLSGIAGVVGIAGISLGLWWADSAAAAFISFEIIHDGWGNLRNSIAQLMNKTPTDAVGKNPDPLPGKIEEAIRQLEWVAQTSVRLREDGDILTGEVFIVPRDERDLLRRLEQAGQVAKKLDWRLHELSVIPVRQSHD